MPVHLDCGTHELFSSLIPKGLRYDAERDVLTWNMLQVCYLEENAKNNYEIVCYWHLELGYFKISSILFRIK